MNQHDPNQPPRITFTSIAKEKKMSLFLGIYEDHVLWSDMKKAEEKEDYDLAIIFRDELARRGKIRITD